MKKLIAKGILLFTLMIACAGVGSSVGMPKEALAGSTSHRAVWVAFYEFYKAGLSNRTEAAFRKNATTMFNNIKAYGCNEVYFHVRAFDDAIYPSKIVGWSTYISTDGKALKYDPLKILVELAHKKGLKIHAWMNPYRVTTSKILNPAKDSTINRIVNQVKEIINNYDVDGIHFDDYFYTSTQFKKVKAKDKRKNVNKMVKKVYNTVKAKNKNLLFGISPAGNYENCMSMGADVKTWMSKPGYIDYIVPQIYWSDQFKLSGKMHKLFTERLSLWRSKNKIDLPMYIGLGVYRAGYKVDTDYGWKKKNNNLATQLKKIKSGNSEGYALFAYTDLAASHSKKEMKNFLNELAWIKLNKTEVTLKKGETFQLTPSFGPSKVTLTGNFKYETSDAEKAVVDEKGLITAMAKEGEVKITVTHGDKKKTCKVTLQK